MSLSTRPVPRSWSGSKWIQTASSAGHWRRPLSPQQTPQRGRRQKRKPRTTNLNRVSCGTAGSTRPCRNQVAFTTFVSGSASNATPLEVTGVLVLGLLHYEKDVGQAITSSPITAGTDPYSFFP